MAAEAGCRGDCWERETVVALRPGQGRSADLQLDRAIPGDTAAAPGRAWEASVSIADRPSRGTRHLLTFCGPCSSRGTLNTVPPITYHWQLQHKHPDRN